MRVETRQAILEVSVIASAILAWSSPAHSREFSGVWDCVSDNGISCEEGNCKAAKYWTRATMNWTKKTIKIDGDVEVKIRGLIVSSQMQTVYFTRYGNMPTLVTFGYTDEMRKATFLEQTGTFGVYGSTWATCSLR